MKKLIIGATLGLVIGGGAMLGVMQIPSVNKAMLKPSTDTNIGQDLETQNKIDNLELNNSKLKQDIENLNTKLTDCNAELETTKENLSSKEFECTTLATEKAEIQALLDKLQNVDLVELENANAELSAELLEVKAELDSYKELVGSDISYIEMVGVLQQDLANKTSQLESATAELEQLRVDKTTLETKVVDLESELSKLKVELENYKSLDDIDILNIDNFNGKWYLNGKFEDYYIIKNGVVTHNANEDTGVIQCLNNQVYLFMNNSGSLPVELSVDGTMFTDKNGKVYNKFYINTIEDIVVSPILVSGTYTLNNNSITLNSDNTLKFIENGNVYYGAYVTTGIQKNIGGNISKIYKITATIHFDDSDEVLHFELTAGTSYLYNTSTNNYYTLSAKDPVVLGTASLNNGNYLKFIVKTKNPISIQSRKSVICNLVLDFVYDNYGYYLNGVNNKNGNFGNRSFSLSNTSSDTIYSDTFEFYFYAPSGLVSFYDFLSIDGVQCEILSVESFGNPKCSLYGRLLSVYNTNLVNTSKVVCDSIQDYVNGTYFNDDISINIGSDSTLITPTGLEDIVATSVVTTAKTDGTDIYQTTTITYSTFVDDVETIHTLVINLINDDYENSTLDGVSIALSKN